MTAHLIESDFPALRRRITHSADWYRTWRRLHLRRYPDSDQRTRDNLDMLVRMAEEKEGKKTQ